MKLLKISNGEVARRLMAANQKKPLNSHQRSTRVLQLQERMIKAIARSNSRLPMETNNQIEQTMEQSMMSVEMGVSLHPYNQNVPMQTETPTTPVSGGPPSAYSKSKSDEATAEKYNTSALSNLLPNNTKSTTKVHQQLSSGLDDTPQPNNFTNDINAMSKSNIQLPKYSQYVTDDSQLSRRLAPQSTQSVANSTKAVRLPKKTHGSHFAVPTFSSIAAMQKPAHHEDEFELDLNPVEEETSGGANGLMSTTALIRPGMPMN